MNIKNLVLVTEANQNFSKVVKAVGENSAVVIKNNCPRYVVFDYSKIDGDSVAENQTVEEMSANILKKHMKTFEKLAK